MSSLVCVLLAVCLASQASGFQVRSERFIDFLIREVDGGVTQPRTGSGRMSPSGASNPSSRSQAASNLATVQEPVAFSGRRQNFNSANVLPYGMYVFDLLFYFRSVPKRHWSCCMLGVLAGDKGYHCHVQLYARDINERNLNRVHSRSMDFYRDNSRGRRERALKTWNAFAKCVDVHSDEFRTCCIASTLQKVAYQKWRRHARHSQTLSSYRNSRRQWG